MLNEEFVLKMMEPYLNSKRELSEFEFFELFSDLERREQYEVINIMIKNDIEYVDEKEEETEILSKAKILKTNNENSDYMQLWHLTNEQLCVIYQNGDKAALAALLDKNKRFVYQLAKKLHDQYRQTSLSVEDLYNEGNIGLIEAAQHFDSSLDYRFITYCWHWVRQKITRAAIDTGFLIRLPVHVFEKLIKVNAYRQKYSDVNEDELLKILNSENAFGIPISKEKLQKYIMYENLYLNTASLNTLVGDDEDSELIDFIPDGNDSVEELILADQLDEDITIALSTLTQREGKIIKMRFGLNGDSPMTLEEVGNCFNVTRERIRQIEEKALKKLRHPSRSKKLKIYLEGM